MCYVGSDRFTATGCPSVQARAGGTRKEVVVAAVLSQLTTAEAALKKRRKFIKHEAQQLMEQAAVDFLGLRKADVAAFKGHFAAMDTRRKQYIRPKEFFAGVGCVAVPSSQPAGDV